MIQDDTLDIIDEQGGDPVPKGGTSTKVDKTPAWDANTAYIQKQVTKYTKDATDYAMQVFTAAGVLPIVNGKQINNINDLVTGVMSNPKAGQEILEQANKILIDKPDLDGDLAASLLEKKLDLDEIVGSINLSNQVVGKDLQNAAATVDAKIKAQGKQSSFFGHNSLINPDGTFKNEDQWILDTMNQWIDNGNAEQARYIQRGGNSLASLLKKQQLASVYGTNPNMTWGKEDPTKASTPYGQVNLINFSPKHKSETEIAKEAIYKALPPAANVTPENFKNHPKYKEFLKQYTDSNKRIIEEYNKNTKTKKVQAERQGIYTDNAGGAKMAADTYNVRFDTDYAASVDDQGNSKIDPGMAQVVDFLGKTRGAKGLLFSKGAPTGAEASDDANLAKIFDRLYDDLKNTLYDKSRKKNDKGRPFGEITFQPISMGDENYHAYHIKMRPEYFKKYMGTAKDPGYARVSETDNDGEAMDKVASGKVPEEGYTVYVPVDISKKTDFGARSSKGTTISYVEGNIALSPKGEYNINIPNAMNITIKRSASEGSYMVSGNGVAYNPNTAKYDTVPLNALNIKSQYGLDVDLDALAKYIRKQGISSFKLNHSRASADKQLRGVRDPKQLLQK